MVSFKMFNYSIYNWIKTIIKYLCVFSKYSRILIQYVLTVIKNNLTSLIKNTSYLICILLVLYFSWLIYLELYNDYWFNKIVVKECIKLESMVLNAVTDLFDLCYPVCDSLKKILWYGILITLDYVIIVLSDLLTNIYLIFIGALLHVNPFLTVTYIVTVLCILVYRKFNYNTVVVFTTILLALLAICQLIWLFFGLTMYYKLNVTINNSFFTLKPFSIYYDRLSITFLLTVYTIGVTVNQYQFNYLKDSSDRYNFLVYFNLFIVSMVLVVLSSNWMLLLLSWELLGISSFFLIGYYKQKPVALKSSIKAFIFNKISDLFLLISFILYYTTYNTFNLNEQLVLTENTSWVIFFILITAFVKSAQFCFYFWLPDSMEAPIPASALIHSATLVSAGIYLVLRFKILLEFSPIAQKTLLIGSTFTLIFAVVIAASQTDIKKLLAYSTIANCSFIYILIAMKLYKLALVYFVIHGILKSFCFIVAGELITSNNHYQDIRKWSNLSFNFKNKLLLLIILILLLSGAPISTVYIIKSDLWSYSSNYYFETIYLQLVILFYSSVSYIYGIKLILFFVNKRIMYLKYRKPVLDGSIHTHTNVLFTLYAVSLIIVLLCAYNINSQVILISLQWSWLSGLVIITLILLSIDIPELFIFAWSILLLLNLLI